MALSFKSIYEKAINLFDDPIIQRADVEDTVRWEKLMYPHLENADYFLIMSVFAGFGGQKFIPETFTKIRNLKEYMEKQGIVRPIEVDGGVSKENVHALCEAGAEIFVAGSAIFKSECPGDYIAQMRQLAVD